MRRLTVRANDQDGAISIMAAGLMLAMLLSTALAVDVGRVASVSRDQQGITDRAALDAVLQVSRSDAATLGGLYPDVEEAALESLERNPGSTSTADELKLVQLYLGTTVSGEFEAWCGWQERLDPDGPPPPPDCTAGVDPDGELRQQVNAIWVVTESVVPYMFAIGGPTDEVTGVVGRRVAKVSVAETLEVAGIMIGSRLASVDASALQEGLDALICNEHVADDPDDCDVDFGMDATTALLSYQGLVHLQVALADLIDELSLSVGSVEQILEASVSAVDLLQATAAILARDGHVAEAQVLNAIATEIGGSSEMTLGELVEFGTMNGQAVMRSRMNVFGILSGTLQVVNGNNLVALPDLTATVPGLIDASASLEVVARPAQAFGPARRVAGEWVTRARTGQVDLALDTLLEASTVTGVVGGIGGLLPGISLGTPTISDVELAVEVGVAEGRTALTSITCDPGGPGTLPNVTEQVTTGVVSVQVPESDVVQIGIPIRVSVFGLGLVNAGTLRVTVTGAAEPVILATPESEDVDFIDGEYPRGHETVDGTGLGLDGLASSHLRLDVTVTHDPAGISGALLSTVTGIVNPILNPAKDAIGSAVVGAVHEAALPVLAQLNQEVVAPSLDLLGAQVGAADVWATSADCAYRRLAPVSLD